MGAKDEREQRIRDEMALTRDVLREIDHLRHKEGLPGKVLPTEAMVERAVETVKIRNGWHLAMVCYDGARLSSIYIWEKEGKKAVRFELAIGSRNPEAYAEEIRLARDETIHA